MRLLTCILLGLLAVGEISATARSAAKLFEPKDEICDPDFSGNVPHPLYCVFFYFCNSGDHTLMECPNGLYYNPRTRTCDFPENVPECNEGTRPTSGTGPTTASTPTTTPTTTRETPETEPTQTTTRLTTPTPTTTRPPDGLTCSPGETKFYPYPKDCTRYYFCLDGVFSGVRSCTSGLWFNFEIQSCRTPWTSTCPY